jgi:hypothetical protein
LRWPTTVTASLIAIATGLKKFVKFKDNLLTYRTISETLRKEPYLLEAQLSAYSRCDDKYKLFFDRVESLL